jgi:prolyl-tRNA editing enzyme YbaK/EbsC (Cys-tRNA(Pro) deacylase)
MSKSLARVTRALAEAGLAARILEMPGETRTAAQAAAAAGCALDQIVKSIVFQGLESGHVRLFLTAGGNRVSPVRASALAGEPLGRANADLVRAETGFAIGGVAPLGHLSPIPAWFDPRLMQFEEVWAAAGTPRHIFAVAPGELLRATGATLAPFTD